MRRDIGPAGRQFLRVDTHRSPNTVIATVRGMGVAVMTRTCGRVSPGPFDARAALLDAEPMLLIDDDETQVGELNLFLQQGVRTDDDPRFSRGCLQQRLSASRRAETR